MCGVFGVLKSSPNKHSSTGIQSGCEKRVAYEVYRGLLTLQHRGQDGTGILSYDFNQRKYHLVKDHGLVAEVFDEARLDSLTGTMAIGHTRYQTIGLDRTEDLQPFATGFPYGTGMAHNGNLVNYFDLEEKLRENFNLQLLSSNDLEVFLQLWSYALINNGCGQGQKKFSFEVGVEACKTMFKYLEGAYALVGTIAEVGMFGIRDPPGLRPLVLGRREESGEVFYCLSSESVALNYLGYELVRDIEPGEFILINKNGEVQSSLVNQSEPKKARCMFEWVYFSGAESILEKKSVYDVRLKFGQALGAKIQNYIDEGKIQPDFVCPVPDTSRPSAISLAENLQLPYREGLIKNRYVHRSFILKTQEEREKAVQLKLSPVISQIKGQNILLVDDSIVRGTTIRRIIKLLRQKGAKNIYVAITCPPITHGCFYGIDFPSANQLVANGKTQKEIRQTIVADYLFYLDETELASSIGVSGLCLACVNGKYPTELAGSEKFLDASSSKTELEGFFEKELSKQQINKTEIICNSEGP